MNRWSDCRCEDFPCCGHLDLVEYEPERCDNCGYVHMPGQSDCFESADDDYEDDDEDGISMRSPQVEADADFDMATIGPFDEIDYERGEMFDDQCNPDR